MTTAQKIRNLRGSKMMIEADKVAVDRDLDWGEVCTTYFFADDSEITLDEDGEVE